MVRRPRCRRCMMIDWLSRRNLAFICRLSRVAAFLLWHVSDELRNHSCGRDLLPPSPGWPFLGSLGLYIARAMLSESGCDGVDCGMGRCSDWCRCAYERVQVRLCVRL
jgi:hypothetical protein